MEQEYIDRVRNSRGYKIIYTLIKEYLSHSHSVEIVAVIQKWLVSDRHWELKKIAFNDLLLEMEYENVIPEEMKNINLAYSHSWMLYIQAKEERMKITSIILNKSLKGNQAKGKPIKSRKYSEPS